VGIYAGGSVLGEELADVGCVSYNLVSMGVQCLEWCAIVQRTFTGPRLVLVFAEVVPGYRNSSLRKRRRQYINQTIRQVFAIPIVVHGDRPDLTYYIRWDTIIMILYFHVRVEWSANVQPSLTQKRSGPIDSVCLRPYTRVSS
jgi:hypothetical protein